MKPSVLVAQLTLSTCLVEGGVIVYYEINFIYYLYAIDLLPMLHISKSQQLDFY